MKRYLIYTLLISICFLTSCLDESMGEGIRKESYTFTAQIEDNNSTRTTVNKNQVLWVENDKIGIFGDKRSNNVPFTLQSADGTSAEFNGELKSGEKPFFAYYPYQENAMLDGSSLTIHLPAEYVYTGNSNAPMLGFSDGNKDRLSFKHLCGLMKVTVTNIPDNSTQFVVTSEGDNPKSIAGTAIIENIQDENATLSIKEDEHQSTSITYALQSVNNKSAATFYIPLPVGEYEKLTIALKGENDKIFFQKSISNASIKRAVILNMPALNCDEDISYVLNEKVVQLTAEDESFILSVTKDEEETSDKNTITYASETPEDKLPKVGDIILYSEITEKFPAGFLGKVTSVEETGDGYVVQTEPAALDEAFDQLYINKTFDLIPQEGEEVQTRIGISQDEDGFFCLNQPISLEKDIFSVNGSVTAGFKLYIHIEIDNAAQKPPYMFVTLQTKATSSLGFGIHASGDVNLLEIPVGEYAFNKVPAAIVLTPTVQFSFVLDAEGDLGFDTNVEFSKKTVSALLCKDGKWEKGASDIDSDGFFNYEMDSNAGITMQGSVFAGIATALELQLFNNDKMKIGITPQVGFEETASLSLTPSSQDDNLYETLKDSKLTAGLGVKVDAEAEASILKDSEALIKTSIFEFIFFEKPYYLFPSFEDTEVSINKEDKTAVVGYNVSRDLIFNSGLGIALYKDGVFETQTSKEDYHLEEDFENPLTATFDGLESNIEYTTLPYIMFGNLTVYAAPEQTFMLEEDEEEEGEPDPENPLVVTTGNATNITQTSATLSGSLSEMKPDETYTYGFVYMASNGIPTIETGTNIEVSSMQDNGAFSTTIESLLENTTYSWCAYACDASGNYTYGSTKTFTTSNTEAQSERDILIAFYNATNGNNWTNNENWCTDKPLGSWYGVTTDTNGHVIELRFDNSANMQGNAILSNLTYLQQLTINSGQLSLLDISNCINLTRLYCKNTNISEFVFNNCINLTTISMEMNKLTSLDITQLPNLDSFYYNDDPLNNAEQTFKSFNAVNHQNIRYISINASLKEFNCSDCPNLNNLTCINSDIKEVTFTNLLNLEHLMWQGNNTQVLDIINCNRLLSLACSQNQLTSLDVSNFHSLETLSCSSNNLTKLDLLGTSNLKTLYCNDNKLENIDNIPTSIEKLVCTNNLLKSLQFDINSSLEYLNCGNNMIPNLDISNCYKLTTLYCHNNNISSLDFRNCPDIEYIGALENKIEKIYGLSKSPTYYQMTGDVKLTLWGEVNRDKYDSSSHWNHYQYPEFIYE